MRTEIGKHTLDVFREADDPRVGDESAFWYALKEHLNAQGHDLVKKIMSADGHLMGDDHGPYYLRDRKRRYCFYDPHYAIRLANVSYNHGHVQLSVDRWKQ